MKKRTASLAIVFFHFFILAQSHAAADEGLDADCSGSTAKGIFARDGKIYSDGGQRSNNTLSVTGKQKPASSERNQSSDKPRLTACRRPAITDDRAQLPPHAGLALWAQAHRCGEKDIRRTTDYRFKTGDCAKLFFMPNINGYLYVANVGSTRTVDHLFPLRGEANMVKAGVDVHFTVEFIGTPGTERIFVFFSRSRINDVQGLALSLASRPAAPNSNESGVAATIVDRAGQVGQPKGLRRTDEVVSGARPDAARYIVIDQAELKQFPIMVLTMDLIHSPP